MNPLPNLLIVDDNEENLDFLCALLRKAKVNLYRALSGAQALLMTRDIELALALIDVRMPDMNGFVLADKLNEDRLTDKVPVIFITASQFSEADLFKGYESGAVDYIFKPINSYILNSKINIFLDLYLQKQTIAQDARLIQQSANELRTLNSTIKSAEEKYRSYIDHAPDGVFVTDQTGRFIEINAAACRIAGYEEGELMQMGIPDLLPPDSRETSLVHFRGLLNADEFRTELIIQQKNGTNRWWSVEAIKLSETRFLGFTKDITDKKMADIALVKSEERFRSFFELTADMVVIADLEGYFKEINSSWSKILGFTKEELLGKPYLDYIHPDDLESTKEITTQKLKQGETILNFENRYIRKDGEIVWMEWTSQPQVLKGETFAIARNITGRKKSEMELKESLNQLHLLMQYNEKVRENERIAISRELHDELGQSLTAIKIDLGIISRRISDQDISAKIDKVSTLVKDTIKTVQRLTSQLRPQILDDLGLVPATEWYADEFGQRTGIKVTVDLDPLLTVPKKASLVIFRIMQESLTNIARHSGATSVQVILNKEGDQFNLRISDNGKGISEDESKSTKSFGIISMKERAASLGGTFNISCEENGGTLVNLILPLNQESYENIDL